MKNQYEVWEIIECPDNQFEIWISINYLMNNVAQMLTDLIHTYKFCYLGLEIPESKYQEFKHTVELNFVYSDKDPFNKLNKNAKNHISQNYLKDILEIIYFQLSEVCQIIYLLNQRGKGYNKIKMDEALVKHKAKLNKKHFPELVQILEKATGSLYFRNHILSINTVRRHLVHRNGLVESDSIELITRTMKLFANESYSDINYDLTEDDKKFIDFSKTWKLGEYISLEYDDCFRIQFTVLSFFQEITNKIKIKFPELTTNQS